MSDYNRIPRHLNVKIFPNSPALKCQYFLDFPDILMPEILQK